MFLDQNQRKDRRMFIQHPLDEENLVVTYQG